MVHFLFSYLVFSSFCFIFLDFSLFHSFASCVLVLCVLGSKALFSFSFSLLFFFIFSLVTGCNVRAICVFAGTWGEIVASLAVGITAFTIRMGGDYIFAIVFWHLYIM